MLVSTMVRAMVSGLLLLVVSGGAASAQPLISVWTGNDDFLTGHHGFFADWFDAANWENEDIPANDGSGYAFFGPTLDFNVFIDAPVDVFALEFGDEFPSYEFQAGTSTDTLTLRGGLIAQHTYGDSEVLFGSGLTVVLDPLIATETMLQVDWGPIVEFAGPLESSADVMITGGGDVIFSADNSETLSGDILLLDGNLGLGHDEALGTGTLYLGEDLSLGFPSLFAVDVSGGGARHIDGPVVIENLLMTTEGVDEDDDPGELVFGGDVTFLQNADILNYGGLLTFEGTVGEDSALVDGANLSIDADSPVIFSGATNITGGIHSEFGNVLFEAMASLPAPTLNDFFSSGWSGYIGILDPTATGAFLDLFDRLNSQGAVGFDTEPSGFLPNTFSDPIDLSGFHGDARIGSVTHAILSGTITPQGDDYQFGNGGGNLYVTSSLIDDPDLSGDPPDPVSRGVSVLSNEEFLLMVFLAGTNTFSSDVTAEYGGLVFSSVDSLPAPTVLETFEGGYIGLGFEDASETPQDFVDRFVADLSEGTIGFDTESTSDPFPIGALDLSRFNAADPDFYLGSHTWARFTGDIVPPEFAPEYRFTGYKGGFVEVLSDLADLDSPTPMAMGVIIGDNTYDTITGGHTVIDGDYQSTVLLAGENTYTGDTVFQAGHLAITNDELGTPGSTSLGDPGQSSLIVTGESYFGYGGFLDYVDDEDMLSLTPYSFDLVVNNDVSLDAHLRVDTPFVESGEGPVDAYLTLGGDIGGSSGIAKTGEGTLILSGDNSFSGGIYVRDGSVIIASDTAAGHGPIGFGVSFGQEVTFTTTAPVVAGLYDYINDPGSSSSPQIDLASSSVLTIDTTGWEHEFEFSGTITGVEAGLAITGGGRQRLSGPNSFDSGVIVSDDATLIADHDSALGVSSGFSPLTLDGGNLEIGSSIPTLNLDLVFGPGGGNISGSGTINLAETLNIASGASLSPGDSIGFMDFGGDLDFGSGGALNLELGTATESNESFVLIDGIFASNINISADSGNRFTVHLDLDSAYEQDIIDGFLSTGSDSYSWVFAYSNNPITGFEVEAIELIASSNLQAALGEGSFEITLFSFDITPVSDNVGALSLADTSLAFTFTPIPEPSTYALFAVGLVLLLVQTRRHLRGSRSSPPHDRP